MRAACVKTGVTGDPNYDGPIPGRRYQPSPHDTRRTGISMHYALRASTPEILAWSGHEQETTTLRFYARATRDRVLTFVASLHLDVEEAWNLLYEMTWAVYGDSAVPPRYDLLTIDYAQQFTDWPLVQSRHSGLYGTNDVAESRLYRVVTCTPSTSKTGTSWLRRAAVRRDKLKGQVTRQDVQRTARWSSGCRSNSRPKNAQRGLLGTTLLLHPATGGPSEWP